MRQGLRNFGWLLVGKLAGSGALVEEDLPWLYDQGVRSVVCLREKAMDAELFGAAGFRYNHIPIPDFEAPDDDEAERFVRHLNWELEEGRPVLVHCRAGLGRTGTMLAIFLVSQGFAASQAVQTVRARRPRSITELEQEDAVRHYHEIRSKNLPGITRRSDDESLREKAVEILEQEGVMRIDKLRERLGTHIERLMRIIRSGPRLSTFRFSGLGRKGVYEARKIYAYTSPRMLATFLAYRISISPGREATARLVTQLRHMGVDEEVITLLGEELKARAHRLRRMRRR
ncbi:MAG: dual specificity protein phosphatase family protein [Candidatus Geothermarchaeales archaeon]